MKSDTAFISSNQGKTFLGQLGDGLTRTSQTNDFLKYGRKKTKMKTGSLRGNTVILQKKTVSIAARFCGERHINLLS